uniref:Uncharacterized protein n=1 Tax=Cucumis melo TaxID=3656 RepID=A0A9I9E140_CUCME
MENIRNGVERRTESQGVVDRWNCRICVTESTGSDLRRLELWSDGAANRSSTAFVGWNRWILVEVSGGIVKQMEQRVFLEQMEAAARSEKEGGS